jgi:hypothetical protein
MVSGDGAHQASHGKAQEAGNGEKRPLDYRRCVRISKTAALKFDGIVNAQQRGRSIEAVEHTSMSRLWHTPGDSGRAQAGTESGRSTRPGLKPP